MATTMTVDEKLAVIARALLVLSTKATHTWDYDGETMVGEGVSLDPDIEEALEQIASGQAGRCHQPNDN